jgi:hypothetical protein
MTTSDSMTDTDEDHCIGELKDRVVKLIFSIGRNKGHTNFGAYGSNRRTRENIQGGYSREKEKEHQDGKD